MIDVTGEQFKIIFDILKKNMPAYEARIFGSRHRGTAKAYSDLDLVIVGENRLGWKQIADLREAFEESNLPFRIDVLDWHAISPEFQKIIKQGYEVIYKP